MPKDCSRTTSGNKPLFPSPIPPPLDDAHSARGLERASQVQKVNGKLVVMFIGMSNWRQEIAALIRLLKSLGIRGFVWYNAGRGNWDLRGMVENEDAYWSWLRAGMAKRNIAPEQVRVLFVKNSVRKGATKEEYQKLMASHIDRATKELTGLEQIFISSAVYSNYAQQGAPRTEPGAFLEGVAVDEFVRANKDSSVWIGHGPYLWADGMNPRGDGLVWRCEDFDLDGVHPGPLAEKKVAAMIHHFLVHSPVTGWFTGG